MSSRSSDQSGLDGLKFLITPANVRDIHPAAPASDSRALVPLPSKAHQELQADRIALQMENQELRETQAETQHARARYFEIFDLAPVPCFIFDSRHLVQELNLAAADLLAGDRARWVHRPFFTHLAEEDRSRFHRHVGAVLARRERLEIDLQLVLADGSVRVVHALSQPILADSGEQAVCLSVLLAPGSLSLSPPTPPPTQVALEAMNWRQHIANAGIAAAITAPLRGWVWLNQPLCQLLGYTEAELRQTTWLALTHPEDRDAEVALFNQLLSGASDSYQMEKRIMHRSGSTLRIAVTVTCVRHPGGAIDQLFHSLHECEQPTSPASIKDQTAPSFDLNSIVFAARDRLCSAADSGRLRWHLASDLPQIAADGSRLQELLRHLVANSIEALSGQSGAIHISTGRCQIEPELFDAVQSGVVGVGGDSLFVEVADEGRGMDSLTQSRLFEVGFSTKPGHDGRGLKIALDIVRAHGGCIRVRSSLCHGTSVQAFFPMTSLISNLPSEGVESLTEQDNPSDVRGKVLLVDDEHGVRSVAAKMIEALGFSVEEADGGKDALQRFVRQPSSYDLVVADLTMPDVDGWAVMAEVRHVRPELPFVMMSGLTEAHSVLEGNGQRPEAFLQKPFTMARLQEILAMASCRTCPQRT